MNEAADAGGHVQWDLKDWPADQIPIVFKKQPVAYEIAPPERLAEWEALLGDRVKLSREHYASDGYLPTLSYCGPNETNCCDSDTIASALEA